MMQLSFSFVMATATAGLYFSGGGGQVTSAAADCTDNFMCNAEFCAQGGGCALAPKCDRTKTDDCHNGGRLLALYEEQDDFCNCCESRILCITYYYK